MCDCFISGRILLSGESGIGDDSRVQCLKVLAWLAVSLFSKTTLNSSDNFQRYACISSVGSGCGMWKQFVS
jgi:hypothetical protein